MKVHDVAAVLDEIAPQKYAEEWDNVGLLAGDGESAVKTLMLCIDLTAGVAAEAAAEKCQMIMAYHPPIFKPVSRLTAQSAPALYRVIRGGIAVYSMHTALDAARGGTNDVLAEILGLQHVRPLRPAVRQGQCKIVVFAPPQDFDRVTEAAFAAGAGVIGNYERCSFSGYGVGSFRGRRGSNPTVGQAERQEDVEELRVELVAPRSAVPTVVSAVRAAHNYEEPAVDVYCLQDLPDGIGYGRVGKLDRPAPLSRLLGQIRKGCGAKSMQVVGAGRKTISNAAVCAGAGRDLLKDAIAAGAELYLTGELPHHDALAAAAAGLTVVCVGHSNSERPTLARLADRIGESIHGLKVILSKQDRDPYQIM